MGKKKPRIIKTQLYRLTDNGRELVSENEYTHEDIKRRKENPESLIPKWLQKEIDHKRQINKLTRIALPSNERDKFLQSIGQSPNIFKNIEAYNNPIRKALESYNNTFANIFNRVSLFQQNPLQETADKLHQAINEYSEAKKEAEDNIWHRMTEAELQEKTTENETLKAQLKQALEKIKKDEPTVKMADYIIKNNPPKPKTPKPKPLTLNPNFESFGDKETIIKTIHKHTAPLFNATLQQWENLFAEVIEPFDNPIELRAGTSKADLRVFIDNLKHYGFIKTGSFLKALQTANAFSFHGKALTADNYKSANNGRNYPNTRNSDKIDAIFLALKVKG